ncbi:hypothetical protein ACET9S_20030 [Aeromonas caviae]|uniref:hypothetical protein n=1 Tax=Aeromonas caviae TaxID=648 RepID=UPI0038D1807F
MRRMLIVGLLIGLGMLVWYLNGLLYHSAWVNHYGPDMDPEIIRGWRILLAAWPLALVGVLGGGAIALPMMLLVYNAAEDADHTKEVEQLKRAVEKVREDTVAEYEERKAAIEELREQSYALIHRAEQREQAVRLSEQMLDEKLAAAYGERDEARQANRNTQFAYVRKVKHAEDLQTQVETLQKQLGSIMQRVSQIP